MLITQTASEEINLAESLGILEDLKPCVGGLYEFGEDNDGVDEGPIIKRSVSPELREGQRFQEIQD